MPIYEYQCAECEQITERMQKFSDPPLTMCPKCGGAMKKLISDCAFHLKGSGWYVTDYARKDDKKHKGEDKGEGGDKGKEKASSASSTQASPSRKDP